MSTNRKGAGTGATQSVKPEDTKRRSPLLLGRRLATPEKPPMGFVQATPTPLAQADALVSYEGDGHLLTIGKTGSGKTALAISIALSYEGSLVCFDSTGSIYEVAARRRREMGQEVHVIDFRDRPSAGNGSLNPLALAARGGSEKAVIARSLAAQLAARKGTEPDGFWLDWAETIITGAIAYALEQTQAEQTMEFVYELFNGDEPDYRLAVLLDTKGKKMNRTSYGAFAGLLQLPEKETRPSVIGTVQSVLRLFDSDMVRRLTGSTSFDIDALIHDADNKPQSIFIIVPSYREAFRPLLGLMFSALLTALMQRELLPVLNTLILSDETASFGKVESFITAATQARQYGLQLWTFWQNVAQIEHNYGKDGAHTLIDNAGVLQLLGAPNRRAAAEFAALVGDITAEEILALGPLDQVVFIEGKVHTLRRLRYFEERMFDGMYDSLGRTRAR